MRARRPLLFPGALTLLLAACAQPEVQQPAEPDPYAGGASHPWSYTAPAGQLTTLSLTPGENNLYYEPILAARNSWGPIEIDRSNGERLAGDGRVLTLNGKTYSRGFGTHAGSEMRFSLKGTGATCTRFTADVGVDDEVGNRGSVVFEVYLDGARAYRSGILTGASATGRVDLDITGKQELRLVVTDAGDNIHYDHADWAQPLIRCVAANMAPNVQIALDPQDLSIFHKHSANMRATFSSNVNVSGPLDLRLEQAEPGRGLDLQLVTTQVDLGGQSTATREITVAAPNGLSDNPADLVAPYRLVASRNGQDVGSAPITIRVRALTVRARFEPASVSGRDGETKRVTVVVTVDPPLDGPVPIGLGFSPSGDSSASFAQIVNIGSSRGDGAIMRADADIRFFNRPELPEDRTSETFSMEVRVGDIVTYRTPGYGTLFTPLELNLIR